MKPYLKLILFLLVWGGPSWVWGGETPTDAETPSPTPAPTETPISASTNYSNLLTNHLMGLDPFFWFNPSIEEGIIYQVGFGGVVFPSRQLGKNYSGYSVECALGFVVSDSFSISAGLDGGSLYSQNSTLTGTTSFNDVNAILTGKYEFLTENIRPYVYAGAGLAFNNYNTGHGNSTADIKDEADFAGVAGFGLEYQIAHLFFIYAEESLIVDFDSSSFAGLGSTDSPIRYSPVLLGIVFER
jgi:hypothetical protein